MSFASHPALASLAFAVFCSTVQIAIGAFIGWRIRLFRDARRPADVLSNDDARDLLDRLHALASETAEGVGAHTTRVREISRDLGSLPEDGEAQPNTILHAAAQILLANEQLHAELATAQNELEQHARLIESHMVEARTDGLVNVPNRRALDEELNRRYLEWQRGGVPLVLLLIDIDHFKRFNDDHGHQAGDAVLRDVGQALSKTLSEVAFVARYGGEEFAVVFRPTFTLEEAREAAERARQAVATQACEVDSKSLRVTISLGLAQVEQEDDLTLLIKHADEALYTAKAEGRNRTHVYQAKQTAPAVPTTLAEAAAQSGAEIDHHEPIDDESSDRRGGGRRPYHTLHRIAPYQGGKLPKPGHFFEVECYNVSAGGFSFLLPKRPDYESIVVALPVEEGINYLTAQIMHTVQSPADQQTDVHRGLSIHGTRGTGSTAIFRRPPSRRCSTLGGSATARLCLSLIAE